MTRSLIAEDFANALLQIPDLQPSRTTVQFLRSQHDDAFALTMRLALQQRGYGLRWVEKDAYPLVFRYRREEIPDTGLASHQGYQIAVGQIQMRRQYAHDDASRLWPQTPMFVRGVDATHMQLDDAHFAVAARGEYVPLGKRSRHHDTPKDAKSLASSSAGSLPDAGGDSATETVQTTDTAARLSPLDPLIAGTESPRALSLPLIDLPGEQNVFDRGRSNYHQLLEQHRVISEKVLTFANDSLRLGSLNKHLVEQMVELFRADSDVFSVLGCSLGPTRLEGGNVALALGRASRVREALLFAGVPQDRILDEGCWAGDGTGLPLPRRGVVLTLNRRV